MPKDVYVFRGAPASGKGTVVPQFCESLSKPVALIQQDKFRWGIHTFGREIADISDEEHTLAYRVAVAAYEEYLRKGMHTVVVEGLFTYDDKESSQGNAHVLHTLAEQYGYRFTSIVLHAAKEKLLDRNKNREYSVPLDEFEQLYSGVYGKIGEEEIVVDSTRLTAQETVTEVLDRVTS
jgi:predicted kinase